MATANNKVGNKCRVVNLLVIETARNLNQLSRH